jgi:PTS system mannose-specific IIA component
MNNGILIIAHAPLASALRQCALHVFPDAAGSVLAFDVLPNAPLAEIQTIAKGLLQELGSEGVLVMTDVFGATPCNVAQSLVDGVQVRLLAGVNLPMVLRALNYVNETLEVLANRALAGGSQGVMQVSFTAPLNQGRKPNDQDHYDHQQ